MWRSKSEIMHMLLNMLSYVHELLSTRIYPMSIWLDVSIAVMSFLGQNKEPAISLAHIRALKLRNAKKYVGRVILPRFQKKNIIFNFRESSPGPMNHWIKTDNWLKKCSTPCHLKSHLHGFSHEEHIRLMKPIFWKLKCDFLLNATETLT